VDKPTWQSAAVAVALIGLVGLMFWRATDGDFATIWAGVGTVVGVVTGAVPSYFFARQASTRADAAEKRTEAYAMLSDGAPASGGSPIPAPGDGGSPPTGRVPAVAATVVAIFTIALVAFALKVAVDNDFASVWAGVGSIVGVVTGAIPNYFFGRAANARADAAGQSALDAARALPAQDPDVVQQMLQKLP